MRSPVPEHIRLTFGVIGENRLTTSSQRCWLDRLFDYLGGFLDEVGLRLVVPGIVLLISFYELDLLGHRLYRSFNRIGPATGRRDDRHQGQDREEPTTHTESVTGRSLRARSRPASTGPTP